MEFYLGTHQPHWLWRVGVPLFISRRTLSLRKSLFPAISPSWALDSGGFSELSMYGEWRTPPEQYISEVKRWDEEIGSLDWASSQDWMCEPHLIQKTGLSIAEHQRRTIENFAILRRTSPKFVPVLQGWGVSDYMDHLRQYERAGFNLTKEPVVGVGSVCRRQVSVELAEIISEIAGAGIRIHGFGIKQTGLRMVADKLTSADSMAWSLSARYAPLTEGCSGHKNCANCSVYALNWYDHIQSEIEKCLSR